MYVYPTYFTENYCVNFTNFCTNKIARKFQTNVNLRETSVSSPSNLVGQKAGGVRPYHTPREVEGGSEGPEQGDHAGVNLTQSFCVCLIVETLDQLKIKTAQWNHQNNNLWWLFRRSSCLQRNEKNWKKNDLLFTWSSVPFHPGLPYMAEVTHFTLTTPTWSSVPLYPGLPHVAAASLFSPASPTWEGYNMLGVSVSSFHVHGQLRIYWKTIVLTLINRWHRFRRHWQWQAR